MSSGDPQAEAPEPLPGGGGTSRPLLSAFQASTILVDENRNDLQSLQAQIATLSADLGGARDLVKTNLEAMTLFKEFMKVEMPENPFKKAYEEWEVSKKQVISIQEKLRALQTKLETSQREARERSEQLHKKQRVTVPVAVLSPSPSANPETGE